MVDKKIVPVPDGRGGWKEQEVEIRMGAKVDPQKLQEAQSKAFIDEAGTLTEKLLQFDKLYIQDNGLSKEHRVFAAALYCVNLRETYPDGPEAFDAIAAAASKYYDENKDKVKA